MGDVIVIVIAIGIAIGLIAVVEWISHISDLEIQRQDKSFKRARKNGYFIPSDFNIDV